MQESAKWYFVSMKGVTSGTFEALRTHLFGNIKGVMHCLPPTEDAFQLHLCQILHQLAVWKREYTFQPTCTVATVLVLSVTNWWQPWCWRRQNLKDSEERNPGEKKKKCARGCSYAWACFKCFILCFCTGDPSNAQWLNLHSKTVLQNTF